MTQAPPASSDAEPIPTPERFAQALERAQPAGSRVAVPATAPTAAPATPVTRPPSPADGRPRSKEVHIDLEALAAAGFVTPQAQRSQIADEFRVIKRPIIRNAREHTGPRSERANLVMVTSAIPAEGKTFVALNLAMSIALEVDSTVLLVDADVANPCIMKMTRLPQDYKGLLDLLTNTDTKLPDVLLRTNVEKLSLLPSGAAHGRAVGVRELLVGVDFADRLDRRAGHAGRRGHGLGHDGQGRRLQGCLRRAVARGARGAALGRRMTPLIVDTDTVDDDVFSLSGNDYRGIHRRARGGGAHGVSSVRAQASGRFAFGSAAP